MKALEIQWLCRPALILSLLLFLATIPLMFQRFPNAAGNSGQQGSKRKGNLFLRISLSLGRFKAVRQCAAVAQPGRLGRRRCREPLRGRRELIPFLDTKTKTPRRFAWPTRPR